MAFEEAARSSVTVSHLRSRKSLDVTQKRTVYPKWIVAWEDQSKLTSSICI